MEGRRVEVVFMHNGATEKHCYDADHSAVSTLVLGAKTFGLKVELENGRDKDGKVLFAFYESFSYALVRPITEEQS